MKSTSDRSRPPIHPRLDSAEIGFIILAWILMTSSQLVPSADAYAKGATLSACKSLTPDHRPFKPQDPTVAANPYRLEVNGDTDDEIVPGQLVPIRIVTVAKDGQGFKGFLLQARDPTGQPVGSFVVDSDVTNETPGVKDKGLERVQTISCRLENDTVTHVESSVKSTVQLLWKAPDDRLTTPPTVTFKGAVVRHEWTFWLDWNVILKMRQADDQCASCTLQSDDQDDSSSKTVADEL